MILSALAGLYERLAADPDSGVAPPGFQRKEIPFLIVLDETGRFIGFDDTRYGEGKRRRGRQFLVPREEVRTGNVKANILWDKPSYVLGIGGDKPERTRRCHEAFAARARELAELFPTNFELRSVMTFLHSDDKSVLETHAAWREIGESGCNLAFRISKDRLVCQHPDIRNHVAGEALAVGDGMQCLVSGQFDDPAETHAKIKGVRDAQSSGACIISFNLDAFASYAKDQGRNAPIGRDMEFAYTTALNALLARDSRQKIQVGDATTVFWSEKAHPMENLFGDLFDPPKENPFAGVEAVKALFAAPETGAPPLAGDRTRFHILGLAPNASRLAIRFWHVSTIDEVAGRIRRHFDDLDLIHGDKESGFLPLWRLLAATALQGKADNVPPNLAGDVMKAILNGTPYPRTLLVAAVRRGKAESPGRAKDNKERGEILRREFVRAALIKAVLVRANRSNPKEVGMALDRENGNIGYRLGRLFALLERCQETVSPGLNATIKDRYYGSASGTPVVAFPLLLRLNQNHLKKLKQEKPGYAVNLDKEIGEIIGGIEGKFPATLDLDNQGRFAIGYYHQRQNFFKKKETKEEEKA